MGLPGFESWMLLSLEQAAPPRAWKRVFALERRCCCSNCFSTCTNRTFGDSSSAVNRDPRNEKGVKVASSSVCQGFSGLDVFGNILKSPTSLTLSFSLLISQGWFWELGWLVQTERQNFKRMWGSHSWVPHVAPGGIWLLWRFGGRGWWTVIKGSSC